MKKALFALALLIAASSCNNSQETATTAANGTSAPLSNEVPGEQEADLAELANKPLSKGAEKFKGEYQVEGSSRKSLIREHPEKPSMLAVTTTYRSHDPVTVAFWYNEKEDVLSDKTAKGEPTFTTIKLDPSGERVIEVYHDWERNQTDTTVYKRIR